MDSSSRSLLLTLIVLVTFISSSAGTCFKSIISFGDSLADTGNLLRLSPANKHPHFFLPPYGESYFHHPNGRCSDGRLVIDFIAESLGLPLVPPYMAWKDGGVIMTEDGFKGVNFAVAGATALDDSFFRERGIQNQFTNVSLGTQLEWFKDMLHSLCHNSSGWSEILGSSLVLVGEIGGNDYNHPLLSTRSIEEIKTFVAPVVRKIGSAIMELIDLGAETLIVPGNLPIGCSAAYLSHFQSSDMYDYDAAGCLRWLNEFAKYHNGILQTELNRIRKLHPHAHIIYADYYNAGLRLYRSPAKHGFEKTLSACCGGGGPYNYDPSVVCGNETASSCSDPSLYACWDGLHLTEAAYKLIAKGILQGPYSVPPINIICNFPSSSISQL